jgi:chromosome segregation ATPase
MLHGTESCSSRRACTIAGSVQPDRRYTDIQRAQTLPATSRRCMKVLYIGSNRSQAQAVITALRGVDHDLAVQWASRSEDALKWLDEHRDVAAVLVDDQQAAESGDLPLEQVARVALEQKLADATAALAEAEQQHRAAIATAEQQLAERQAQYEIAMARTTATWDMVDEQLRAAALEVERARRNQADADAEAARLSQLHSDLASQLAESTSTRSTLEHRLADAHATVEAANASLEEQRRSAADQMTARQREFEAQIAQETEALRLSRLEAEARAGEVDRLTAREAEHVAALARLTTNHDDLARRLTATEAAFDDANTRATRERLAASKRAAEREAELNGQIGQERAARAVLEQAFANADAAVLEAQRRLEAERASASATLAEAGERFDRELSQLTAARARLIEQMQEGQSALDRTRREHEATAAEVERLTRREADLTSVLAEQGAERHRLEEQLVQAQAALQAAVSREADLTQALEHERVLRAGVEQTVADGERAAHDARARHEAALAGASEKLAEQHAEFARESSALATERDRIEQRLQATEGELKQLRCDYEAAGAAVERLTRSESELTSALAQASRKLAEQRAEIARESSALTAERDRIEQQLQAAGSELKQVRCDYESARAAVERLTRSESELTSALAGSEAARDRVEGQLGEARGALQAAAARDADLMRSVEHERELRTTLEHALADAEHSSREEHERHEAALAEACRAVAAQQAEFAHELSALATERERVEQRLQAAEGELEQSRCDYQSATAASGRLETHLAETTAALATESAARHGLEQLLSDARAAAAAAEQASHEQRKAFHARQLELEAEREVERAQERLEYETRMAETEARGRAFAHERDALQQSLATVHQQTKDIRLENQRLFERAGVAMFRCTRAGVLTAANRACTTLVGRRTIDELVGSNFAAVVFDAPNVLSWLVEHCVSARGKESVETTWRRQDGGRLFVRLSARLVCADGVEVIVEDLTRVRALQERLGQANRMEAVGRLASEVSATCGSMLTELQRKGRQWLTKAGIETESRQHGELLFEEVGRAAGYLRQLADGGDEHPRTPRLVDLTMLIHDLEPVLKRVAGGDVDIMLRDASSPLIVDVRTEQVERLLVNLASYGRERMPIGGRLKFELATAVVDRRFAARHPNVRLGLHALITLTEIKRMAQADHRNGSPRSSHSKSPIARPGLDLGTLQDLVSECGGHLWMNFQPRGETVTKVRLPLVRPDDQSHSLVARGARQRATGR